MLKKKYELAPGVVSERVGQDVIVLLPETEQSFQLSGQWAEAFTAVELGTHPSGDSEELLDGLAGHGFLVECPRPGISRRSVLRASATGLGAGVVALSLPTVAAASSGIPVSGTYEPGFDLSGGGGGGPFGVYILVVGFDFPNDLGDGTAGSPNPPSSLNIAGFSTPIPVLGWMSTGDSTADGIDWFLQEDPAPGIFSGTITGRFTWGGTAYVATLTRV